MNRLQRSLWSSLLLLAASTAISCSRHSSPTSAGGAKPSQVVLQRNVDLTRVIQKSLPYRVETVGMLEAEHQTDIPAGVPGIIDEIYFREGDEVGPGTLLAKIDQRRYEADEELARANVDRLRFMMELAQDQFRRVEKAVPGVSEEELVKARFGARSAEAEYRAAQAAWERARNFLEKSRVRAPYSGRINKRLVTKGTYVEEKTPLGTIADLSRMRLAGFVPETAAPVVRELFRNQERRLQTHRLALLLSGIGGQPGHAAVGALLVQKDIVPSGFDPEFQLQVLPGKMFLARIFYLSTVADPTTHMFEAKAEVLGYHPEQAAPLIKILNSLSRERREGIKLGLHVAGWLPGLLANIVERQAARANRDPSPAPIFWPGLTAKIYFNLKSNPNALVVPEEAVRASERGFIAFVPEKKKRSDGTEEWVARARMVDLGFRTGGMVEVRQGLEFDDPIVRRGAEALEDGTPIRFTKMPPSLK